MHDGQTAMTSCEDHRGRAQRVLSIYVCPLLEQAHHRLFVPVAGCAHERSHQIKITHVDINTLGSKLIDAVCASVAGGHVHCFRWRG